MICKIYGDKFHLSQVWLCGGEGGRDAGVLVGFSESGGEWDQLRTDAVKGKKFHPAAGPKT